MDQSFSFNFNTNISNVNYSKNCKLDTAINVLQILDTNRDGCVDQLEINNINGVVNILGYNENTCAAIDFVIKNYRDLCRATDGDGLKSQQMDRINIGKLAQVAAKSGNSTELDKSDVIIINNEKYVSEAKTSYVGNLLAKADVNYDHIITKAEWDNYMLEQHGKNMSAESPQNILDREAAETFIGKNFNNLSGATNQANSGIKIDLLNQTAGVDGNNTTISVNDITKPEQNTSSTPATTFQFPQFSMMLNMMLMFLSQMFGMNQQVNRY